MSSLSVAGIVPIELMQKMHEMMVRIRLVEERIAELVDEGEVRCPCHLCIGQEAIAAGVCAALERDDWVWGGHRSHGHYLAKGGSLEGLMAEVLGRRTGCSGGRGGSMHLFAAEVGILGTVPLVAATIPIAVGAALAAKMAGKRRVSVSFFGDGAVEEGHFHEAMNLASLYQLPVIFVCENNFYSSHLPLHERRAADNIHQAADVHSMPGERLDGNDVAAIHAAAVHAVARARQGQGPTLLECRTYRWRGHVGSSCDMDVGVKRRDELGEWLARDPIDRSRRWLLERGVAPAVLEEIERQAGQQVETAVAFARSSPHPDEGELPNHVYLVEEANRL